MVKRYLPSRTEGFLRIQSLLKHMKKLIQGMFSMPLLLRITLVQCEDTNVLVLLLYHCGEGDLHLVVCMFSGHSGKDMNCQHFIP
jgi:hypothetical protein